MPRTRSLVLLALFSAAACEDPGSKPEEAEKSGTPAAGKSDLQERLAVMAETKRAHDALAKAYAAGELGDRLVTGAHLLVDPKVTGVKEVEYFVFKGAIPDLLGEHAVLETARSSDGSAPARILHGGVDAARPAIFDRIAAGAYTVCVVVGPAIDPEEERVIQEIAAEYEAKVGFKLTPETLVAMSTEVEARLGRKAQRVDWSAQPGRCVVVEVGAEPQSRVVALPLAPPPPAPEAAAAPATPAAEEKPLTAFAGWKVKSAQWSDGTALALPSPVVRAVAPCLRTVKTPEAEVQITVAGAAVKKVEVRKNSLKCVDELPGTAAPGLARDGELTAIFARKP